MYAKLEEEYGLAKRAMSIYDRATQVVADEDRFEVCSLDTYFDIPLNINRCSRYISPKLLQITVYPQHGLSMNELSKVHVETPTHR